MKISDLLQSNWLRKEDLADPVAGEVFTIRRITEELVGADQQSKWALHWRERDVQPMLLNKTNLRLLASIYGDETDQWVGKEVEVYFDPSVSYGSQIVGGLRVRPPRPPQPRRRSSQPVEDEDPPPRRKRGESGGLPDDDIPFDRVTSRYV